MHQIFKVTIEGSLPRLARINQNKTMWRNRLPIANTRLYSE